MCSCIALAVRVSTSPICRQAQTPSRMFPRILLQRSCSSRSFSSSAPAAHLRVGPRARLFIICSSAGVEESPLCRCALLDVCRDYFVMRHSWSKTLACYYFLCLSLAFNSSRNRDSSDGGLISEGGAPALCFTLLDTAAAAIRDEEGK